MSIASQSLYKYPISACDPLKYRIVPVVHQVISRHHYMDVSFKSMSTNFLHKVFTFQPCTFILQHMNNVLICDMCMCLQRESTWKAHSLSNSRESIFKIDFGEPTYTLASKEPVYGLFRPSHPKVTLFGCLTPKVAIDPE